MSYNLNFVVKESLEELRQAVSQPLLSPKILSFKKYNNSLILPSGYSDKNNIGGVFDADGNLLPQSTLHEGCPKRTITIKDIPCKYSDEVVIFLGTFHSIWGHALTDSLKKLWFLDTQEGKNLILQGAKLAYIYLEDSDNYTHKVLRLAGVDDKLLMEITEPTHFKEVYLPDSSILYEKEQDSRKYTKEYKQTVQRMLANFDSKYTHYSKRHEKVYFSRKNIFQNGREWGEYVIEKCFQQMGYEIISPEKLPMVEQIAILRNCKCFATTEGSISHNVIFCRANTNVVIVRKVNRLNYHQLIINDVAEVDVTYIDANVSYVYDETQPLDGPFYLCQNKNLENYSHYKLKTFPIVLKPSFWWYYLTRYSFVRKFLYNRNIIHKIEYFIWKRNW